MLKVLFFVLIVFALGFGFAWLADMPGEVVMTIGDQAVTVSLMVAGVVIVAAIVVVMLIWWVLKTIITSPHRFQKFFKTRRRDRGYQALSKGVIAAGSGDISNARKMLKQADGLLDSSKEPLVKLLEVQANMLDGNHDDVRKQFEDMLEDPETRVLGLRGLYMEAQRLGERDAQRHYAEKAVEVAPQLGWASKAALDLKTADGDWDGAIRLLDKQKSTKQISKEDASRKRAVLLTALAMENAEIEPSKAKSAGLEAHKLAPDFAPAAIVAAEAAFRLDELRRGVKVLETTWKKMPHPDIALAYVNARPGDSALDRLKRAKRLAQLKPNHIEADMIVGRLAMEAGEFDDARKALASVLRNEPRESAFMLMADIEDAQTGDQGKMREWLSRAVRAPRDAAWTADGYVSEKWAPFSPVSGKIDAFEWKVPVERIGDNLIENDLDPMVPGTMADDLVKAAAPAAAIIAGPANSSSNAAAASDDGDIQDAEIVDVSTPAEDISKKREEVTEASDKTAEDEAAKAASSDADVITVTLDDADDAEVTPDEKTNEKAAKNDQDGNDDVKMPIPDDPGVADEKKQDKRFRLF